MANANRPQGLKPHERCERETPYVAGGTVYPLDAVKMNASGQIVAASAGDALRGVAVNYATSGQEVRVWDDPQQKFVVQADDGTSIATTMVGLNFEIIATAGNATYKQSRMELDADSGTTDSAQLRLLGIKPAVDNAAGEFAKCIVLINEHELKATAGI